MFKKLDWDSDFFKIDIYQCNVFNSEFLPRESLPQKFDLLYVISNQLLKTNLFSSYVGGKVYFQKELNDKNLISNENLDFKPKKISKGMIDLAILSGKYSRFNLDYNIPKNYFEKLYMKWIENSLNDSNKGIIIYEIKNKPCGFVCFEIIRGWVQIGLVAVESEYQGKGIGEKLLFAVENESIKFNLKRIVIPTQLNNQKAIKFYNKLGYKKIKQEFINHIWSHENPI
jgi:dTDP-4-amino-4,6-dideoxy-D-galactose acyltransferase